MNSSLEPLDDLADVLMGSIADEHVHMIGSDLAGDDLQLVLRRNLTQKIANAGRHLPGQHPFAVFRAPHNMNLEVVFRVAAQSISSHNATSSTLRFA